MPAISRSLSAPDYVAIVLVVPRVQIESALYAVVELLAHLRARQTRPILALFAALLLLFVAVWFRRFRFA